MNCTQPQIKSQLTIRGECVPVWVETSLSLKTLFDVSPTNRPWQPPGPTGHCSPWLIEMRKHWQNSFTVLERCVPFCITQIVTTQQTRRCPRAHASKSGPHSSCLIHWLLFKQRTCLRHLCGCWDMIWDWLDLKTVRLCEELALVFRLTAPRNDVAANAEFQLLPSQTGRKTDAYGLRIIQMRKCMTGSDFGKSDFDLSVIDSFSREEYDTLISY